MRLSEVVLKLKLTKCNFVHTELEHLGHLITSGGLKTNTRLTSAVRGFPIPQNAQDVGCFLGLTLHYRRFVHKFTHKEALNGLLNAIQHSMISKRNLPLLRCLPTHAPSPSSPPPSLTPSPTLYPSLYPHQEKTAMRPTTVTELYILQPTPPEKLYRKN